MRSFVETTEQVRSVLMHGTNELTCLGGQSAFPTSTNSPRTATTLGCTRHAARTAYLLVRFFIAFVFLVVGCFLDAILAIIIVGTMLEPLARSVNMHPVLLRSAADLFGAIINGSPVGRKTLDDGGCNGNRILGDRRIVFAVACISTLHAKRCLEANLPRLT